MVRNISQWDIAVGWEHGHSTRAANSSFGPLGGSNGLCETSLYNLLRVITSENIRQKSPRNTHTLSKCTTSKLLSARLRCSSALHVSLWVGFLRSSRLRRSHNAPHDAQKQASRVARESFSFPRRSESTLYQLRWEHVTAISGHRSLCKTNSFPSALLKGLSHVGDNQMF